MKQKVIKTERGWAGHYICSDRCQFRRNTLLHCLENDVRIVVSTVGAMRDSSGNQFSTIGCNRVFETMVFHARFDDLYWDADILNRIYFKSDWAIQPAIPGKITGELVTFDMDAKANDMHENVVTEILERLEAGEAFEKELEDEDKTKTST